MTKVSGASHSSIPTDLSVQPADSEVKKVPNETSSPAPEAKPSPSDAKPFTDDMRLKANYVEANLRQQVNSALPAQKSGSASPLNGVRLGWLKDGSEVKITRSLSPANGHETRMEAIAYARISGANPAAVVRDRDGKYHAVQLDRNFHTGWQVASDNNLREVGGLPHFDKQQLADYQKRIAEARDKGDYTEVSKLQKQMAAAIFGVEESEINYIRSSNDRLAGKININAGKPAGGLHGAEKAPNTNFDPAKKNAMEIGFDELNDPSNASAIIFHENSHAKDYALTQHWVKEYEKDTGKKFVPGDKGDPGFTLWVNGKAPKLLSYADAELVSDVSANANGSSEAKAYVGTFINALKAGNPEAAAAQLRTYARGLLAKPKQLINRPTGLHVELELKRQLEKEYRKMPKEMQRQFDKVFEQIAKTDPDAWISKFNHATALNYR